MNEVRSGAGRNTTSMLGDVEAITTRSRAAGMAGVFAQSTANWSE